MTIFDLLFIVVFFAAVCALITAAVLAVRGSGARALATLRKLGICVVAYLASVYTATALSKQIVLRVGEPECTDDWCLAVDSVHRMPKDSTVVYEVTLRIFSRAQRVSQREMSANDVYLVDANWQRFDPIRNGSEIPLDTLLQPSQSVTTKRTFQVPSNDSGLGLVIDRRPPFVIPVCLIIGECDAFHKTTVIRVD